MEDVKNIIETLLFVATEPITVNRIKTVLPNLETKAIKEVFERLVAEYEERKGGFHIREVAGGYQFSTRPEYGEWIQRYKQKKPKRFSKPVLETLAIIAYKQPVIRSEVERIRGVDSGGVIRTLLERKLIKVVGRKEIPGRPLIYVTTKKFLETFELKDLRDLPSPKEIEAIIGAEKLIQSPLNFPEDNNSKEDKNQLKFEFEEGTGGEEPVSELSGHLDDTDEEEPLPKDEDDSDNVETPSPEDQDGADKEEAPAQADDDTDMDKEPPPEYEDDADVEETP